MTKENNKKLSVIAACTIAAEVAILTFTNRNIQTTEHVLNSDVIKKNLNIVHLSDLHNYSYGKCNKFLINKVKNVHPDLIIMTGDMVDAHCPDFIEVEELIKELKDIALCVYTEGNHEAYLKKYKSEEYTAYIHSLEQMGVIVLINKSYEIPGTGVVLHGIQSEPEKLFINSFNKGRYNIVLCHNPAYTDEITCLGPDLILSGHTHGGQVFIPGIGRLFTHGQGRNAKYISGKWFINKKTTLIVSNGLGSSRIHPVRLRINVFPEIINIKIAKGE